MIIIEGRDGQYALGADVIDAASAFDRRVTFEYVMLGGVNDSLEQARQLAELARRCKAFVNLIPLHPGGAGDFTPTSPHGIAVFARAVRAKGVEVAIRTSRGMDIAAACGQLRGKTEASSRASRERELAERRVDGSGRVEATGVESDRVHNERR